MMTGRPTISLDLGDLWQIFEDRGWDAIASDELGELAARLEYPPTPGTWTMVVDRAGRFRFGATYDIMMPIAARLEGGLRDYDFLLETQQVLTVTGQLGNEGELAGVLEELTRLAEESYRERLQQPRGDH